MNLDEHLINPTYDGGHITRQILIDFFGGKYDEFEAAEIESHCGECIECKQIADTLIKENQKKLIDEK